MTKDPQGKSGQWLSGGIKVKTWTTDRPEV